MLMQITYKSKFYGEQIYIYDDEHLTEEEAQFNLRAHNYSPYGFSMYKEHFELLKKYLRSKEE